MRNEELDVVVLVPFLLVELWLVEKRVSRLTPGIKV